MIWNEFEELVEVKVTIYITVPDYSSHLLLACLFIGEKTRRDEKGR